MVPLKSADLNPATTKLSVKMHWTDFTGINLPGTLS
jgi:hypothetical protein